MVKSTKIVATIGPACESEEMIRKLYEEGMNVARLNFSHGDYDYFEKIIERIRRVSDKIGIMLDTKGPEIRTGKCEGGSIKITDGQELLLTNSGKICTSDEISINYDSLEKMRIGNHIFFDDGLIESEIIEKRDDGFLIRFLNSGILGENKTVSIHGHNVEIPFMSDKDRKDIEFGIAKELDFIAASFVRNKEDVLELKKFLDSHDSTMHIISKIEHWNAVDNIEEVIDASDGVMVARGDLGVEIAPEKVPGIQKKIIKSCNRLGRPVIVATQMLESMRNSPRPTRAEVNDVANAIISGADAVMLSAETASGKYPVESVIMMRRIADEYDSKVKNHFDESFESLDGLKKNAISLYMTKAAYMASKALNTRAILTPTESGYTARKVSRFKPNCPILAIARDMRVVRQLQLSWGVYPSFEDKNYAGMNHYIRDLVQKGVDRGFLSPDDKVVLTAGHKLHQKWTTNIMQIYYVKDVLEKITESDIIF